MTRNDLSDAAVAYAARNWRVIALHFMNDKGACSCSKGVDCRASAKHPVFAKWRDVATTDPLKLRAWWRKWPRANVGVLMGGVASLVTIDIDGDLGRESLAALEALHSKLPLTLTQSTGRAKGGVHHIFHVDPFYVDWIKNRAHLAPGIDIRSEGGLIVAAPSIHPTGAQYRWIDPTQAIAELPQWLFDLALSRKEQQRVFSSNGTRPSEESLAKKGWPLDRRMKVAFLRFRARTVRATAYAQRFSSSAVSVSLRIVHSIFYGNTTTLAAFRCGTRTT